MTAWMINQPVPICPKCERTMRNHAVGRDDTTITVVCDCDGVLYTMKRPSVALTAVRRG